MQPPEASVDEVAASALKFSVIVPVYNPGGHIDDLLRSLDAQTMRRDEFEVIFVDDGSTDGTAERLDTLLATHPNYLVRHIPNSGWPGKPRNVGLDLAKGEYVAFVDNDDYLGVRALDLVYQFASTHDSDIVVAREVGVGRNIGTFMFRHTVPDAKMDRSPVLHLMTPHKVYRRKMLEAHRIRFPEGKVRLEDHLFNVQAYFAARRLSIYADYAYYYWTRRKDGAHASSRPFIPEEYFGGAINNIMDVVDQHTAAGWYRDQLKSYWLGKKILPHFDRTIMLGHSDERRREMYRAIRSVVMERFTAATASHLGLPMRVRANLLRAERMDDMVALAKADRGVTADVFTRRVSWEDRCAAVHFTMQLTYRDGSPVEFCDQDGRILWEPPMTLPRHVVTEDVLDVTSEWRDARVDVLLKRRGAPESYSVPTKGDLKLVPSAFEGRLRITFAGHVQIAFTHLQELAQGESDSVFDLSAQLEAVGWSPARRMPAPQVYQDPEHLPTHDEDATTATFYATKLGNLSIRLEQSRSPR